MRGVIALNSKYYNWTKEELIEYINDMESLIEKESDDFLVDFAWAGNLGLWYWNYKKNIVKFNDKKVEQLGYDASLVGDIGFEFFTNKIHADDYEGVMENMRGHLRGDLPAYEVEYRIQHKDGHYLWYYDRGTVVKRSEEGTPEIIQGIVFDITESKKIEKKLKKLSERDALTNLYNRRMFHDKVIEQIEKSNKSDERFTLVMLDIDHFKKINDTYGHLVGDETLKKLADLITEDKRSKDIVFRYGGEEFFLLLPDTPLNDGVHVAKRLHQLIAEMEIPKVGNITVSMGVVEHQKGETIDDLVKNADELLYDAKDSGRNLVKSQES